MSASYQAETGWHRYQSFFPPRARLDAAAAPKEEWMPWRDGSLHIDRYAAADARFTIILIHGAGGYGRLLAPIGWLLRQAGYEVLAPDLPGYGLSHSAASNIGYDGWVDCLAAVVKREYRRNGRPIVLCGGSLGGYLAYLCAARVGGRPIAGIIATNLIDPRLPIAKAQFARNAWVRWIGIPLLPFFACCLGRLRLPIRWFTRMHAISNDVDFARLIAADERGGGARVPVSFMASIFAVVPDIEPETFEVCPVLLAHPADDRWTSIESSLPVFDRLKGPKELVMLENCGHFPIEEPGISQLESAVERFLQKL